MARFLLTLTFVVAALAGPVLGQDGNKPAGATILDGQTFWRVHATVRPPVVPPADGEGGQPRHVPVGVTYRSYPELNKLSSEDPPADWAAVDFDDAGWARLGIGGGVANGASLRSVLFAPGVEFIVASAGVRGKFTVTDPASAGSLALEVDYRGGVVVYLNGREVARKDMPAGPVSGDTTADPYPDSAWLTPDGKPIPDYRAIRAMPEPVNKQVNERIASRNRTARFVLPADLLRKGTNVLGVRVFRSPYHPAALMRWDPWPTADLTRVHLTATGKGVVPNTGRPRGVQVFNQDVLDRVSVADYGDPQESLYPIRLVGARNGSFSGQLVVGSTEPIEGLKVSATALKGDAGEIPAARVRIRYGLANGSGYHVPDWFSSLVEQAPAKVDLHPQTRAAVQMLRVTVDVPADAAAGDYAGTVSVSAGGRKVADVPLTLSVAAWSVPDPKDYRTYVGVYQSPTSVAMQYKVPMWSEKHWELIGKSYDLLAQIGNRMVIVPLVEQTQYGNDEGFVYWVRQKDGSFTYDFSVFDRLIALVKQKLPKPDFVALQVWHSSGWEARKADQPNTVTVVDAATGKHERMQVPVFGTEESKKFWKPVLDAVRARLQKAGMADAMCLGTLSDGTAPNEVFEAFHDIAPDLGWTRGCHSVTRAPAPYTLGKTPAKVVCHEFCYGMAMAVPERGLPEIWKQRVRPGIAYIRHNFDFHLSLLKYHNMAERALYCGTRGIGRIGLDYWSVQQTRGGMTNIYNRYPHSSCSQRAPNLYQLVDAGPDGAVPSVRFDNLREGLIESEATIQVAEAWGEHADRLGPELAERCKQVFTDRINFARRRVPEQYGVVYLRSYHEGWRDLNARLFATAAEVQKKLGK